MAAVPGSPITPENSGAIGVDIGDLPAGDSLRRPCQVSNQAVACLHPSACGVFLVVGKRPRRGDMFVARMMKMRHKSKA